MARIPLSRTRPRRAATTHQPARPACLKLEALEGRCLPAAPPSAAPLALLPATTAGLTAAQAADADPVVQWNAATLRAVWADGSPPTQASRTLAMVQVAVYDAVDAIEPQAALYPVPGLHGQAPAGASPEAAVAGAADTVLQGLFPAQQAAFDADLQAALAAVPDGPGKDAGLAFGRSVGQAVLAWRATDGAGRSVAYQPGTAPGAYQLTPPGYHSVVSPQWPQVTPWAMTSGSQFRPPPPPALGSAQYAADFIETKALGSATSTVRTPDETDLAHYWSDLSGVSVTPPGHWNEIAETVSLQHGLSLAQDARLFALLDVGLADAAISCWDAKYFYNTWRPVTAIRNADADGNPSTGADPNWTPLWATPAFPEYTSGHSTFSGTAATILTSVFGAGVGFTAGSDDLPGYTRSFADFQQAADEAGRSRIYGGIHFESANLAGLASGRALGAYVVDHFLTPGTGSPPTAPSPSNAGPAGPTWTLGMSLPGSGGAAQFAVANLADGGVPEVIVLAQRGPRGRMQVGLYDASTGRELMEVPLPGGGSRRPHAFQLALVDVNGNGQPDVVIATDTGLPIVFGL